MAIKGNGVGAILSMSTAFDLSEQDGATLMKWEADVRIAGPVGAMGQRVLQPIVNQQVQHVLTALEQQVQEAEAGAPAAEPGDAAGGGSGPAGAKEPSPEEPAPEAGERDDYGPPAESTPEAEPPAGASGAGGGLSP